MDMTSVATAVPTAGKFAASSWSAAAVAELRLMARSQATPLLRIPVRCPEIAIFLKDESAQATGSLKFRLALALMLDGVCSGRIHQHCRLFDASSGSTAIAEAGVAARLGLDFTACVPVAASRHKVEAIRQQGASVVLTASLDEARQVAARLAAEQGGHFLDQFTQADRVMDWRSDDCLGSELLRQVSEAGFSAPGWIVMAVGTGSSLAAVSRHIRYAAADTKVCLADPEASQLHRRWLCQTSRTSLERATTTLIEGIGACGEHPGFNPALIDAVETVRDGESIAAAHVLSDLLGRKVGASTGASFCALARLAVRHRVASQAVLLSFIYDDGERYADSIYNEQWLQQHGIDLKSEMVPIRQFIATGVLHGGHR